MCKKKWFGGGKIHLLSTEGHQKYNRNTFLTLNPYSGQKYIDSSIDPAVLETEKFSG